MVVEAGVPGENLSRTYDYRDWDSFITVVLLTVLNITKIL